MNLSTDADSAAAVLNLGFDPQGALFINHVGNSTNYHMNVIDAYPENWAEAETSLARKIENHEEDRRTLQTLEAEKRAIFFNWNRVRNEILSATADASKSAKAALDQESALADIEQTNNISQAVTNQSYVPYSIMTPEEVQANLNLATLADWEKCGSARCEFVAWQLKYLGWADSPFCKIKNWRTSRQIHGESTKEYREYLMKVVEFHQNEAATAEETRAAAAPNDAEQQHAAIQQMIDYDAAHGPGSFLALLTVADASATNKKQKRTHDQM